MMENDLQQLSLGPPNPNDIRPYIDSELSSIRSRIKHLTTNLENIDKHIKSKEAHLVSNAYHMSAVESNTNNSLFDVKNRLSTLENHNTNTVRDLASINSIINVLRQDQQRLLSKQTETIQNYENKFHSLSSDLQTKTETSKLTENRTIDDLNHRINQIESSFNNKLDTISLKLTNQLQNLERMITDERRTNLELINGNITRFENKMDQDLRNEHERVSGQISQVVENIKTNEDSIDFIIEKLKSHESKTSNRLRSLNEDYQKDFKTVSETLVEVQGLIDTKTNLIKENLRNELLAIKKLIV